MPGRRSRCRRCSAISKPWSTRLRERDSHLRQAVADREAAHAALGATLASLEARVRERTSALADATARAERATRAKGEFLANMSHEIRTPMSGVIGLAEVLVSTRLDSQQQELAQTVLVSGRRLLGVINNILDLSKIESGRLVIEAAPFAFRPVVAAAVETARASVGDRPVRVHAVVADDIPDWLLGDGARLAQVIDNLLSNAVKFTAVGEVRLRAFVAYGGRAVPMLRIDVSDTGIGIEADRMAQIFQPFELGDASMTRRYGGTGLGLAISTRLADLMDGWVRGASVPGEGATFTHRGAVACRAAAGGPGHRARRRATGRCRSWSPTTIRSTARSPGACWSAWATACAPWPMAPRSSRRGVTVSTT